VAPAADHEVRRYIGIRGNPDTTAMTLTDQW
jgi:hypothetical protein